MSMRRDDDPTEFAPNGKWRLRRTWLFSGDAQGRDYRHNPAELSPEVLRVHETRSWAPRTISDEEDCGPIQLAFEAKLASLSDDEREVLQRQGKLTERVEQRLAIAAGDLVLYQRDGYTLVPGSARTVERRGMAALEVVEVVGYECVQVEALSYAQIAEQMGIAVERVHSLVKAAMRKMRARQ